jgi:hypothetical protein
MADVRDRRLTASPMNACIMGLDHETKTPSRELTSCHIGPVGHIAAHAAGRLCLRGPLIGVWA